MAEVAVQGKDSLPHYKHPKTIKMKQLWLEGRPSSYSCFFSSDKLLNQCPVYPLAFIFSCWISLILKVFRQQRLASSVRHCVGFPPRNWIGHVHVADNDRWYPGHAHYNFAETFSALHDIGYKGALALETRPLPDSSYAGKRSLEFLNTFL